MIRPAALALLFLSGLASAQETAESIMARVAQNQETAQAGRSRYVYRQKSLVRMLRGNKKLAREEKREYTVTPTDKGTEKRLESLAGRYERKNQYLEYTEPGFNSKGLDIDGDLMESLTDSLMNDKESRDGIELDLFPLRPKQQAHYDFRLEGVQRFRGRDVYRITFRPKPKDDEASWKGEALVDREEFQPVLVSTQLASGVPLIVKTVFGTNVHQVGFQISYARVADGVWFPVSYGTEFGLKALFLYKRTITISMANSDFRATKVDTALQFE